jgi:hypothetical protein
MRAKAIRPSRTSATSTPCSSLAALCHDGPDHLDPDEDGEERERRPDWQGDDRERDPEHLRNRDRPDVGEADGRRAGSSRAARAHRKIIGTRITT